MNRRSKELYTELGPMLFARANRTLKNDKAAQEITLAVVDELARAGKLPTIELAKRGRELVKHHLQARGNTVLDSLMPGDPIKPAR